MESKQTPLPLIAYLTILDKQNQPVISRNFLCEHLQKTQSASDPAINVESLRMQMSMVIYATIDVLEEKQKLLPKPHQS